jgi:hypothetical protein
MLKTLLKAIRRMAPVFLAMVWFSSIIISGTTRHSCYGTCFRVSNFMFGWPCIFYK